MPDTSSNNKRIAKNTLLLYLRTIFVMVITLYTSRIVLEALGIDDYGIYNVVGGFVAMFSLISGSLSGSIMRFITFELGHGDRDKLKRIFSTAVNIQVGLSVLILILIETIGLWFLNYKMNIPADRMIAANWVLHCSAITFVIQLISVPYNSVIVAHEKMSAFAYISILEVTLKLIIVYLLYVSSYDKLVVYAILQVLVATVIRIVYGVYCTQHFEESRYHRVYDKTLLKEMTGFAGWTFFTSAAYLFNTQGVNILINMFFNVGVNAARGIATQVQSALMQFVNNFTTAMNPQITKLYAAGNMADMVKLVIRGAKFTYLLSLLICLPVLIETEYILNLWLVEVPPHTVAFIRLTIIGTMIDHIGTTGYTACMATGTIRRYVIWITSIGCLVFPFTWLAYLLGGPVEMAYIVFALVYIGVDSIRLWIMKGLLNFPVWDFVKEVVLRSLLVTALSVILPLLFVTACAPSLVRLIVSVLLCVASTSLSIYVLGLSPKERQVITAKGMELIKSKIGKH